MTATPKKGGNPVSFGVGDLVTFPAGLSCTWEVKKPQESTISLANFLNF